MHPSAVGAARPPSFVKLLTFSLKRALLTAPYWHASQVAEVLRFFVATRRDRLARTPVVWFHDRGLHFALRPVDWPVMEAILLDQQYAMLDALFPDEPPQVILDGGANVGLFSVYALGLWPRSQVWAIEPDAQSYAVLAETRRRNPSAVWRMYRTALWSEDGSVSQDASGMMVPAMRLDHFMSKHMQDVGRVSLLKLDIEGAEEAVLRACPAALERVDVAVVELHPAQCDAGAVVELLRSRFPHVRVLDAPDPEYPFVCASRREVSSAHG